ncbi:MAG: hypothetical protein MO846_03165 [Candidatus Devosia symbiotica]|nr:hypothetical protein [Candidatus Devosia symbiotica]
MTGERFLPETGLLHPYLAVETIRPRDAGGPVQINNFIALEEYAANALLMGRARYGA